MPVQAAVFPRSLLPQPPFTARAPAPLPRSEMSVSSVAQTEGIALAQAADLPADKLLTVLDQGAMSNPMFRMKVIDH